MQLCISLNPPSKDRKATDYSLWKAKTYLKRPMENNPPIRNPDGSWAKNNEEKALAFSLHLSQVFKPFVPDQPNNDDAINAHLQSPLQLCLHFKSFTNFEDKTVIMKELNADKEHGYDLIKGKALKRTTRKGISVCEPSF